MTADFSIQRTKMVDGQLRTTDVTHVPLLDAMQTIPREEFVPARRRSLSYIDEDIEVAPGRYIMEPSPFAKLVQLARIGRNDFVLDIGTATGYSAAVLSRLCDSVVALESDAELAQLAGETLSRLGHDNVAVVEGPLGEGWAAQAPYDAIVIEGAVDHVPERLTDQLRDGGRLVAVVGQGNAACATLFVRENGRISRRSYFNAAIRPLAEFAIEPAFQF
jgi:protein-L-isoaspartate(D-aspartate) O-methyltransferase